MGNVCCGNDESKKAPALDDAQTDHESLASNSHPFGAPVNGQAQAQNNNAQASLTQQQQSPLLSPSQQKQENERQEALREEQARLELIVQAAGRSMVATSKGNMPYYNDQGFAAALAQHLEQTTTFPSHVQTPLPAFPKDESVYTRLSQGLEPQVNNGGALDERVLDPAAEAFLDAALVTKERLFAGVKPIVENLI